MKQQSEVTKAVPRGQEKQYLEAAKILKDGYKQPFMFMEFLNDINSWTNDYFNDLPDREAAKNTFWILYFLNKVAVEWVQYPESENEVAKALDEVHSQGFVVGYIAAINKIIAAFVHMMYKFPNQDDSWTDMLGVFEPLIEIGRCFHDWEKRHLIILTKAA